jgi:hypothetical protein
MDDGHAEGKETTMNGLMMDGFQLSLTFLVERAERLTPSSPVVSRLANGSLRRMSVGEAAARRGGSLTSGGACASAIEPRIL